jgi:D-alanine-D-alanine ligase
MNIGIAFDLKTDFARADGAPDDALEEYDSPATVDAIERVLAARGHRVMRLAGGRRFVASVLETPPDLVFNIAEGRGSRSREAHVPAVCEMLGIAVTHSDPLTMALALDKAMAKRAVASAGVATPRFAVIESARDLPNVNELGLEYPLFAKPLFEGSSMGIRRNSKIESSASLVERVGTLLDHYREPVLVEEFCTGPEFTVAVLGTGSHARIAGAMEIVPKKVAAAEFVYSLEVKRNVDWRSEMEYAVPPRKSAREIAAIEAVALAAHRALGCRDIARIDVRTGRDGEPKFIEANPLPGVAPGWSDLALLWEGLGRTYDDLIGAILDEACARLDLA